MLAADGHHAVIEGVSCYGRGNPRVHIVAQHVEHGARLSVDVDYVGGAPALATAEASVCEAMSRARHTGHAGFGEHQPTGDVQLRRVQPPVSAGNGIPCVSQRQGLRDSRDGRRVQTANDAPQSCWSRRQNVAYWPR